MSHAQRKRDELARVDAMGAALTRLERERDDLVAVLRDMCTLALQSTIMDDDEGGNAVRKALSVIACTSKERA